MTDRNSGETKGQMSVNEAGQRGGERTAETHGRQFYEQSGHKGGQKGGPRVRDLINKGKESEQRNS